MALPIHGSIGAVLTVIVFEVLPCPRRRYRPLGIHEKHNASGCMGMTRSEALVGVSAAAAGHYLGHCTGDSRFLNKLPEAFTARRLQHFAVAPAFHV